jgi:hypothetical protein
LSNINQCTQFLLQGKGKLSNDAGQLNKTYMIRRRLHKPRKKEECGKQR